MIFSVSWFVVFLYLETTLVLLLTFWVRNLLLLSKNSVFVITFCVLCHLNFWRILTSCYEWSFATAQKKKVCKHCTCSKRFLCWSFQFVWCQSSVRFAWKLLSELRNKKPHWESLLEDVPLKKFWFNLSKWTVIYDVLMTNALVGNQSQSTQAFPVVARLSRKCLRWAARILCILDAIQMQ